MTGRLGLMPLVLVLAAGSVLAAPTASAAAVVGAGTVENTSTAVTYSGSWTSSSSSQDSGGSVSTLAAPGDAQITFQETSVKIIARTAGYYGIAYVYLDGSRVATLDQYSSATTYKTVAYTSPVLAYGTHTLRVERSGIKNDASSGRTVNVDSFVVADTRAPAVPTGLTAVASGAGAQLTWAASPEGDLAGYLVYRASGTSSTYASVTPEPVTGLSFSDPALTPGATYRYRLAAVDTSGNESPRTADSTVVTSNAAVGSGTVDNSAPDITYSGSWSSATSTLDSAGSVATLAAPGWAQLGFKGTGVKVLARTSSFYGIADVYLDNTLVSSVDLYSAATTYKKVVFSSSSLPFAVHTVRVERSGTKSDASSGRTINLDAFVVVDDRPPATPTGFTVVADGAGARLGWSAVSDTDLAGYVVERATGSSTSFTTLTDNPVVGTTYSDPALTPRTTYRYRISAVDTSGNASSRTAEVSITTPDVAVGPGTYENTADDLTYSGTWSRVSSPSDSGGSVSTLASAGWSQLAFRETSVRVLARTGSFYGIANIYLDGTQVATVDLYSAAGTNKTVVWTSPTLAYGVHVVRIERSGAKNDASSGRTIDLDALVVPDTRAPTAPHGLAAAAAGAGAQLSWSANSEVDIAGYLVQRATGTSSTFVTLTEYPLTDLTYTDPALTPGASYRYRISAVDTSGNESPRTAEASVTANDISVGAGTVENTASDLTYSGAWTTSSSSLDSGGSVSTLAANGYAQLAFRETAVKIIARTASQYGIANVYLDDALVATLDLYSASTTYKSVVYSSPNLPYGVHTVRIERAGTKNDASTGRTINLDSIVVLDSRAPATPSGLTATTEEAGARLTWTAGTENDLAGYLVYRAVGSGAYTTLTDAPVPSATYLDPTLDPDTIYHYRVAAVDSSGNVSGQTGDVVLASRVSVTGPGTVENTSDTVAYNGSWTTSTSSSDSGGSSTSLAVPGYAQIAFRETSIKIVARTASYYGIANLYLDGAAVGTVDLYSDALSYKTVVWTSPTLAYGTHTLRVERSGSKNDASTGRTIDIDSFVIPDTRPPAVPTGLAAAPEGAGARLRWNAVANPDVDGYLVYRAPEGTSAFTQVSDSPVSAATYLDAGLSPDTGYRYRVTAVDTSDNESAATSDVALRSAAGPGTYAAGTSSVMLTGGSWARDVDQTTQHDEGMVATGPGTASLTFLEAGVRWTGSTGPAGGIARVYVDDALVTSIDQYSASVRRDVTLFETSGLGAGAHTIKVSWTGDHDPHVTATPRTSVKAFVVPDATAPAAPRSVWALPSGNGIDLEWNDSFDADTVGYRVYRAKGSAAFTQLTGAPQSDTSYLDPNLVPGTTYRYQVTAVDANGNESSRSDEASATTAVSTGTVENSSPAIIYSTPWSVTSSTRDSGGGYASLGAPGDARFTFSGTGIKWVTRTNNFSGIGQVYLDGEAVAKVDLYSAAQQYQQVVWSTSTLTDGTHTIRIERTGTMNAASVGRNLTLDAFVVTDSTAPPTVPGPTLTSTRLGTKVSWPASSAKDVAAYNLLRTGPDGVETVIDRLPPTQLSFLDIGLSAGTGYRFRLTAIDTSGNESTPGPPVALTTPPAPAPVRERYGNCPTATRSVSSASGLQYALKNAAPGDVIVLAAGTYTGTFSTSVAGTESNPVWVCGPRDAVIDLKDPTKGIAVSLFGASWVTVTGMTVQNAQKGVVVTSGSHVTVSDVHFADLGDEAVHLRGSTVDSTVIGNLIERTGLFEPQYGEGVYIGSDPDAWCTYSACAPDRSDRNSVLSNTITGVTAEAVDAKAGTSDGTIAGNTVDGAAMSASTSDGLIVVKGNSWLVSGNNGTTAPLNGFTATYSKAEGWGGSNVFVANQAAVGNTNGYAVWTQRGIGNLVGCDNSAPGGVRTTNVVCQR